MNGNPRHVAPFSSARNRLMGSTGVAPLIGRIADVDEVEIDRSGIDWQPGVTMTFQRRTPKGIATYRGVPAVRWNEKSVTFDLRRASGLDFERADAPVLPGVDP